MDLQVYTRCLLIIEANDLILRPYVVGTGTLTTHIKKVHLSTSPLMFLVIKQRVGICSHSKVANVNINKKETPYQEWKS